ncbi:MAG: hypothetical protein Q9171_003642 [Xanthocarpia ochracea]
MPNNSKPSTDRVSKPTQNTVDSSHPSLTLEQALKHIESTWENAAIRDQDAVNEHPETTAYQHRDDIHPECINLSNNTRETASPPSNSENAPHPSSTYSLKKLDHATAVQALQAWLQQRHYLSNNPENTEQQEVFRTTQTTFEQALMDADTTSLLAVLKVFSASAHAQFDWRLIELLLAKLGKESVWADIWRDADFKPLLDDGISGARLKILLREYLRSRRGSRRGECAADKQGEGVDFGGV